MTEDRWGFYSQAHADASGTIVYETVNGDLIHVTAILPDRDGSAYHWPDKVLLGRVTSYAGPGRPGLNFNKNINVGGRNAAT